MPITDLTPYREDLKEFSMTDEEQLVFLNAIWTIGKRVVDKKLGLHQSARLEPLATQPLTDARAASIVTNRVDRNHSGV